MIQSATSQSVKEDWLLQFFISGKYRVYRHLIFIAFIMLVIFNSKPFFREPALTYARSLLIVVFLLLFYTNMYLLVPRFFFKNRYGLYSLYIAGIIAIAGLGYRYSWNVLGQYKLMTTNLDPINPLTLSFVILILVSASTAIKLFQRSVIDNMRMSELQKITMRSEMEQLKNQINPHFLFNMLNNANVLTQTDPLKASQVLMKLSDLLRYQLYDSARSSVLLTAEIHFLDDFLNLEKVRRDNFEFIISRQGELSGVQIAPLLLITFVENAIKHNIDPEKASYVNLYFDVHYNVLHFRCFNSKPRIAARNDVGGLGLANVKRRLELIYPSRYKLMIDDKTDTYTVSLTINL